MSETPSSDSALPRVARLHLAATYTLLTLGTAGLWLGEPSASVLPYPLFTLAASILAFVITDRPNGFQLPIVVCNLLAVAILVIVAMEFSYDGVASVLAMAHFLVYLQIVKFFRRKSDQDLWQLYGLNLLQVAIACVLNREMSFGILLFAYAALGVLSLILFHLKRTRGDAGSDSAWSLRSLAWPWIRATAFVLPVALVMFFVTPRAGEPSAGANLDGRREMRELSTGFSSSLELNEMQKVMENRDVVFNVWAQGPDGRPTTLPSNILWRGQVFVTYRNNSWSTAPDQPFIRPADRAAEVLPGQARLRIQQVTPTKDVLFSPKPLFWARTTDPLADIEFVTNEGRLRYRRIGLRDSRPARDSINYSLIVGLGGDFYRDAEERSPAPGYLRLASEIPPNIDRVVELAKLICVSVPANDVQAKIKRLTEYFEKEGGFAYTLDLDAEDKSLDRLEDFVFNRKRGHCEYFATALAVMLRAVGVPTRTVTGFKGADFNQTGGYYQVRELLAHSWVEAYIAAEDRWQSLDPTPNDLRNEAVELQRSPWQGMQEMMDAASNAWTNHFVGYSNLEQRDALAALAKDLWSLVSSSFKNLFVNLPQNFFRFSFWMSFQGFSSIALAGVLFWLGRRLWRLWNAFRSRVPRFRRRAPAWPLFRDWSRLVARMGFERLPAETPREFAHRVAETLQSDSRFAGFTDVHTEVIDNFYAAKYGGQTLDAATISPLENRLQAFAKAAT
jgi:transglutaminase-like putative cysteine protease